MPIKKDSNQNLIYPEEGFILLFGPIYASQNKNFLINFEMPDFEINPFFKTELQVAQLEKGDMNKFEVITKAEINFFGEKPIDEIELEKNNDQIEITKQIIRLEISAVFKSALQLAVEREFKSAEEKLLDFVDIIKNSFSTAITEEFVKKLQEVPPLIIQKVFQKNGRNKLCEISTIFRNHYQQRNTENE